MIVALLFGSLFLVIALGLPIALSIGLPAIGFILTPGVFPFASLSPWLPVTFLNHAADYLSLEAYSRF
jgi:hypothetical protein